MDGKGDGRRALIGVFAHSWSKLVAFFTLTLVMIAALMGAKGIGSLWLGCWGGHRAVHPSPPSTLESEIRSSSDGKMLLTEDLEEHA
eukprot:scaffold193581_cov31-Tisochrysis_lutea.AAC.1